MIFFYLLMQSALNAGSLDIDYFKHQNIYRFADNLYNEGDYLRAAGEFQRYLFAFNSSPPNTDSVFYKIGRCYRFSGHYDKAIEYFQKIVDNYEQSKLLYHSHYQIGLCYFLMNKFEESTIFLNSYVSAVDQNDIKLRLNQLKAINYIQQKEWDNAIHLLNANKNTDPFTIQLANLANEGQQLPRKNKVLAGLFSTVIPGTGKLYCNRPFDGFQSLFTTAVFGWQTYDGFHEDGMHSVKGWIFGVIGGIFYLGNIYGSVVAAEIYNVEKEEKHLGKIKVFINVNLD